MRSIPPIMKRLAIRGGQLFAMAVLLVGLTGCYTQLATVDNQGRPSSSEREYQSYEDEAYGAYEDRYYGRIDRSEYRVRLNTLGVAHFGDPFFYYEIFGDPLWYDPLYQPRSISRVRFGFTFGRYQSCYYVGCGGFFGPSFGSSFFIGSHFGTPGFGFYSPYRYSPYGYGSFFTGYRYGFGNGFYSGYNAGFGSYYASPIQRRLRDYTPRRSTVGRSGTRTARTTTGRSVGGREGVGRSSGRSVTGRSVTGRSGQADRSARGRVGRSADRSRQGRATTGRQNRKVERATPTRRSSGRNGRVERTTGRSASSGRVGRSRTDVRREVSKRIRSGVT